MAPRFVGLLALLIKKSAVLKNGQFCFPRLYFMLDVIKVSAPVHRIGFWGFSDLVRTFGPGLGDCWDGMYLDFNLGLLDNDYI